MNWKGEKVLVTGADGFIGSHLAERLVREGAQVSAFVFYNSFGTWGWLDHSDPSLRDEMEIISGDVRDADRVAEAAEGCEAVFHLAALISVPYSFESPESFIDTNVRGTLNVLNAARKHGASKFIQTSSSEVYGTPKDVPICETHPLQAQSPYAASKTGADQLAESFCCAYGLPVVVLRPFNTYGPRQSARAVLPAILTQLLAGNEKISLGAIWPRRDFTYVEDTVEGFLCAASSEAAVGRTVQLGTGRDVSIGELVEIACRVLGKEAEVESEDKRLRPEKGEVHRLLSDPSLAEELLDWSPAVSLEEGVARTAEWLREWLGHYKTDQYLI